VTLCHVIVPAYVEYERKIGHVVAGPVRPVDQVTGEVVVHHETGYLFEDVKYVSGRQRAARLKGCIVEDHPLIVVRAAVVELEEVHPVGRVVGQAVSDHRSHKFQYLYYIHIITVHNTYYYCYCYYYTMIMYFTILGK